MARAHFDHGLARPHVERLDNPIEELVICQKVLP